MFIVIVSKGQEVEEGRCFKGVEVTLVLGEEAGEVCRGELMEGPWSQPEVLDHVGTNVVGGLEGEREESRRLLE